MSPQAACHAANLASQLLKQRLQQQPVVLPASAPSGQYDENGTEILPSFPTWMGPGGQQQQGGVGGGGVGQLVEEAETEVRQLQVLLRQVRGRGQGM